MQLDFVLDLEIPFTELDHLQAELASGKQVGTGSRLDCDLVWINWRRALIDLHLLIEVVAVDDELCLLVLDLVSLEAVKAGRDHLGFILANYECAVDRRNLYRFVDNQSWIIKRLDSHNGVDVP